MDIFTIGDATDKTFVTFMSNWVLAGSYSKEIFEKETYFKINSFENLQITKSIIYMTNSGKINVHTDEIVSDKNLVQLFKPFPDDFIAFKLYIEIIADKKDSSSKTDDFKITEFAVGDPCYQLTGNDPKYVCGDDTNRKDCTGLNPKNIKCTCIDPTLFSGDDCTVKNICMEKSSGKTV